MICELSKIQYVEALLENFPDGEKVIQERIVFCKYFSMYRIVSNSCRVV